MKFRHLKFEMRQLHKWFWRWDISRIWRLYTRHIRWSGYSSVTNEPNNKPDCMQIARGTYIYIWIWICVFVYIVYKFMKRVANVLHAFTHFASVVQHSRYHSFVFFSLLLLFRVFSVCSSLDAKVFYHSWHVKNKIKCKRRKKRFRYVRCVMHLKSLDSMFSLPIFVFVSLQGHSMRFLIAIAMREQNAFYNFIFILSIFMA